jgi:class 3 adenylate cyclase
MMVLFNDPVEMANPTERAIRMVFAMRERLEALSHEWRRLGYHLGFGFGIAHGYATLGSIGYEGRMDYGAVGTVTNLASGLGGEAKHGQVLASQRVAALLEDIVQSESLGNLTLKDFPFGVNAHTILRLKE